MKKYKVLILCIILTTFLVVGVSFAFVGDTIPIHFGIDGKVDQYGSKYFILLFPAISLIAGVSMMLVSNSKKVSENYAKYLLLTGVIIELIFLILSVTFIVIAIEDIPALEEVQFSKVTMTIFGILFIVLGNVMPKIEKNRTLGIKTVWSLYNETTWQKTHRFAGFVSVIVGILTFITGLIFDDTVNFTILMILLLILTLKTSLII